MTNYKPLTDNRCYAHPNDVSFPIARYPDKRPILMPRSQAELFVIRPKEKLVYFVMQDLYGVEYETPNHE